MATTLVSVDLIRMHSEVGITNRKSAQFFKMRTPEILLSLLARELPVEEKKREIKRTS